MTAPRSPGWYPAPNGGGEQWWNGVAWSESRRDGTTSRAAVTHVTPSGPPPAAPVTNITPMAAPHAPAVSNITPPAPYRPIPYAQQQPMQSPAAAQAYGSATSQMTPAALAAFITGLLSIVVPIAGVAAVILGVRALSSAKDAGPLEKSSRTYATIGIVIGAVTSLFGAIATIFFVVAIFSPTGFTIS